MTIKSERASLMLIYTGGTIGMKQDPIDSTLKPFNFDQILEEVPELKKFAYKIDSYSFDPIIDSSDIEPKIWQELASLIFTNYDDYDGFVILHGTDTMAFSSSALSFMFEGLTKPIIFTGSQLPIGTLRTDGKENLISSVEIATAKNKDGNAICPEVCIYFNNILMRGNRATKINSEGFRAFSSPNYPPLAKAGISIKYDSSAIRIPSSNEVLKVNLNLDTRVSILKIHPGITPEVVENILLGKNTRAIIIETYGSGNAISKSWFIEIIQKAIKMDKILLNTSQCLTGSVNMDIYANGAILRDSGVISGYDSTTESALAKLFYLMGLSKDNEWVKTRLNKNLRGEI